MAWLDLALVRRTVQLTFTGLLVLALSLLLGSQLWTHNSLLDRLRVGGRAEGNIKATRDFDYMPSDERLERERTDAVRQVLPVFDYRPDLSANIITRIGEAFGKVMPPDAGVEEPPAATEGQPASRPAKQAKPHRREDDQPPEVWAARFQDFSEALEVELSASEFGTMRKYHFSPEARSTLQVMVGTAMSQMIVSHRGTLAPFKEQTILVRSLVMGQAGRGSEERISNFARIKDLSQVREELRLQAGVHTAKLPRDLATLVEDLAIRLIDSNLAYNRGETDSRREAARHSIRPVPLSLVKGQVIIRDGDPITREHINMIRAMETWRTGGNVAQEILGLGAFVLLVLIVVFRLARQQFNRFFGRPRDMLAMGVLLVSLVGLAKGVVSVGGGVTRGQDLPLFLFVIPIAAGAMLTRLLISAEAAGLFATVLAVLCGLVMDRNLGMTVFYMVTGFVGAAGVAQVQSRSTILRAGLAAGAAGGALVLAMRLYQGDLAAVSSLYAIFAAAAGGVLSAFMTLALLPAVEWAFAYTTDVTLLELANLNHPLLRDLILRAPGTYHHSMVVGSLSEAACETISANGLMARVASYYHDIGKVKNALYFAENFKPGENPHNRLKPSMSALIIRSHVKDTLEMLREYGIPELVIDTATQHHGKTLIEFFFHKANEQKEEGEEVREEDYRYPGPKPQSREAGVIMLADGVEAAARSLAEPTEDRLRAVVQRVINGKFTDGQLDHCQLTLRDLHLIARSFLQVLRGIYHQRPSYPWQQQQTQTQGRRVEETKREVIPKGKAEAAEEEGHGAKGKAEAHVKEKPEAHPKDRDAKKTKPEIKPERKGSEKKSSSSDKLKPPDNGNQRGDETLKTRKAKGADAEPAQPAGEGASPPAPGPVVTDENPPEGGADLKRLGLS